MSGPMALVAFAVSAFGLIALEVWMKQRRAKKAAYEQARLDAFEEGVQEREYQSQLLKDMRERAAARAAFEGVDFVLVPCVCNDSGRFEVDCRRCDDTGYVEVIV